MLKGKDAKSTDLRFVKEKQRILLLIMMAGLPEIQSILGGNRNMENVVVEMTENLDKEWVDLIINALNMGISSAEIRDFLHNYRNHTSLKL